MNYKAIHDLLISKWYICENWLSEKEIMDIESSLCIRFPLEYKNLLQQFLPTGNSFPNWRDFDSTWVWQQINSQFHWILFDVDRNDFRHKSRWVVPLDKSDRNEKARYMLKYIDTLIPVYGHRYISSIDWWPILSIHQTDIIPYWKNLETYLWNEFWNKECNEESSIVIPFRSNLILR